MRIDQRAALERELADQFDAANLSVYGDYLQAIGDPRGELIALDLAAIDAPARRAELAHDWLGGATDDLLAIATIEHGFLTDVTLDGRDPRAMPRLATLLAGPGAAYLRGLTLRGGTAWLRSAVELLATRHHGWLARLAIHGDGHRWVPVIDDRLAAALVAAAPRLTALDIWGHAVFGELAHPGVTSLRVTGGDAIGSLIGPGAARLPALAALDLALYVEQDRVAILPAVLDALLLPERVPALRRLDLSRNEPGVWPPHALGRSSDPFQLLASRAVGAQLTEVRMPSVHREAQAALLAQAIAGMPRLRELAVARDYTSRAVALPSRVTVPPAWPWQPLDQLLGRFHGEIADPPRGGFVAYVADPAVAQWRARSELIALPHAPLVWWLEQVFARLPSEIRTAWSALLARLLAPRAGLLRLTRPELAPALHGLELAVAGERDVLAPWRVLRDRLAAASDAATVELHAGDRWAQL